MRKWNALISGTILILFGIHAVAGIFQLTSLYPGGNSLLHALGWIMAVLIAIHAVIGVILTVQTFRTNAGGGKMYWRENRVFWARRISGAAVMLLIIWHVFLFQGHGSGAAYRLNPFGVPELVGQILMVICIAVHVLTNIRPLLISFGIAGKRVCMKDVLFLLSVILLLAAAAFIIYYLRWNVYWRYG